MDDPQISTPNNAQTVSMIKRSSRILPILIVSFLISLSLFTGWWARGYFASTSTVVPTIDPVAGWKIYSDMDVSFKYPSDWEAGSLQVLGSKSVEEIKDAHGVYSFTFTQITNYNNGTGRPFKDLYEFIKLPYALETVIVGGQEAIRPLPRAGSENIYGVFFFSKDLRSIYGLELEAPRDGSKAQEVPQLFDQILATFRFTILPEAKMFESKYSFLLPNNYRLIKSTDKSVIYGVGNEELLFINQSQTIDASTLSPCTGQNLGKRCVLSGKNYGQDSEFLVTQIGGTTAESFYLRESGPDNAYHIIQTTKEPFIELKMSVAGGGLDQAFQNIVSSFKFTR